MTKIALVYDNNVLPDYNTGVMCQKALKNLGFELTYYPPLQYQGEHLEFRGYQELPEDYQLYFQIDDDLSYPGPVNFHPSVYWCVDNHRMSQMVGGMTRWQKAEGFDFLFVAQKNGTDLLSNSQWLPLGFDHEIMFRENETEKKYDWCFIGNLNFPFRRRVITELKKFFPNCFVGNAYGSEMRQIYNSSRIILNISISNDINMRIFEAQACGGLLITNSVNNGENELCSHLVTYDSFRDLLKKMHYYLNNEPDRKILADLQYQETISRHSFQHRMQKLTESVKDVL